MILTVLQREDCLIWRCLCKVCVCTIFVYSSVVIDDKSHTRGNKQIPNRTVCEVLSWSLVRIIQILRIVIKPGTLKYFMRYKCRKGAVLS